MMQVYLLLHSYVRGGGRFTKRIGIYSTREGAEQAVQKLRTQPGFKDYPAGFAVHQVKMDQVAWIDGTPGLPTQERNRIGSHID